MAQVSTFKVKVSSVGKVQRKRQGIHSRHHHRPVTASCTRLTSTGGWALLTQHMASAIVSRPMAMQVDFVVPVMLIINHLLLLDVSYLEVNHSIDLIMATISLVRDADLSSIEICHRMTVTWKMSLQPRLRLVNHR